MIKAIVFDLGGVVFTNGTTKFARYIAKKFNLDFTRVYELLGYSKIGNAYRKGEISRHEFWNAFKKELNIADDNARLEQKWIETYLVITETKQILEKLNKKHKLYFLSDNVKERAEAANKKYNFISWFSDGIFSHEVGVRKPNIKIYKLMLAKIKARPEEVLFIDDKQINLPPAEKLGIKTFLFKSPNQLKAKLLKYKLL